VKLHALSEYSTGKHEYLVEGSLQAKLPRFLHAISLLRLLKRTPSELYPDLPKINKFGGPICLTFVNSIHVLMNYMLYLDFSCCFADGT